MTRTFALKIFLAQVILITSLTVTAQSRLKINVDADWQFRNQEDFPSGVIGTPDSTGFSFDGWSTVCLPQTAKIEPLVVKEPWRGVSWYKKDLKLNPDWKGRKIFIEFEAVMQQAEIWINGKYIQKHTGGYLPFTIDITQEVSYSGNNRIVVKTDNNDNSAIPPGKAIANLDFCYYSGIYRNVSLIVTNPLYITDAVKENIVASGGLKIWYPKVTKNIATISASTHLRNEYPIAKNVQLLFKLTDKQGKPVSESRSVQMSIDAAGQVALNHQFDVVNPNLWHPDHPFLYNLSVDVLVDGKSVDIITTRIGIRKFEIQNDTYLINGEPILLVGTNRHQEYPYIGNALSDNAQYRDALKIKQAGFNIVRLSHYPQSPAFMDACDELGILTIDAIPGWQFMGNDQFILHSYQDARDLIRRDRNHACIAMWELSLNESDMSDAYMKMMNQIANEEFPETKLYTCGWIDRFYDVFIPARQHAKPPHYWKNYTAKTPLFTAEYGDWEYFAQDAGLNQAGYSGLTPNERTSRQLRGDGEKRLLQQATNFQEAHNDNLIHPHLGDANWLMFDYNRGYSPDIEASGIMDIFRLPKFSYYMYRSQSKEPTLKIATYWNENSDYNRIKVYSNCEEVALYLNERLIERKKAGTDNISDQLPHPPFVFSLKSFEAGTLKAIGYIGNKKVAEDIVNTSGNPTHLNITADLSGKSLEADGSDAIFVYVTVCDKEKNPVHSSNAEVQLTAGQGLTIIGPDIIKAEAGIATFLVKAGKNHGKVTVYAKSAGLHSATLSLTL